MTNEEHDADGELHSHPGWTPKTPKADRPALDAAPLARMNATPRSAEARTLMSELAERYPRPQGAAGKAYARRRTLAGYENAGGALLADLLAAIASGRTDGWIRCSRDKSDYTGPTRPVSWAMFDGVQKAWLEAGLIEHKAGYPGMLAIGNPGPNRGKLTRYRATLKLLRIAEVRGVTPANLLEHFEFAFVMPSELIQLSSPAHLTPNTQRVAKLREEVASLNAFATEHPLTHPSGQIKHLGWIRIFHQYGEGYRWNKGGRLYSQPQGAACYQWLRDRTELRINGQRVVELDISSTNLTIFYALCDEQLDLSQDAYAGILGPSELDRSVAKFWVNASLSNGALLSKWTKKLLDSLNDHLQRKDLMGFDKKRYPMNLIRLKVLQRHPLLERLGGLIRGRTVSWADLMYIESQSIIGAMLTLMNDHRVPSFPVHDSLLVPVSKYKVAREAMIDHFRRQTGRLPRVKPEQDPEDW